VSGPGFQIGSRLGLVLLLASVAVQALCPLQFISSKHLPGSMQHQGCHGDMPGGGDSPAQQHEKCCAASHSQQACVADRYVGPKLLAETRHLTATEPLLVYPYSTPVQQLFLSDFQCPFPVLRI